MQHGLLCILMPVWTADGGQQTQEGLRGASQEVVEASWYDLLPSQLTPAVAVTAVNTALDAIARLSGEPERRCASAGFTTEAAATRPSVDGQIDGGP